MGLIYNLSIRVSSISFTEREDQPVVQIRFNGVDSRGEINLNGYVVASQEEYFQNASMEKLQQLVKDKVTERIQMSSEDEEEIE